MKRQLWVTDWAPNGTNDLLIVENGEVLAYLDEATFGINVLGGPLAHHGYVGSESRWINIGYWPGADAVRRVALEHVSHALAVSPVRTSDEAEARVLAFLNEHGII